MTGGGYFRAQLSFELLLLAFILCLTSVPDIRRVEYQEIASLVKFGVPVAMATLPLWIVNESGKLILGSRSLDSAGIFVLCRQLVYVLLQML